MDGPTYSLASEISFDSLLPLSQSRQLSGSQTLYSTFSHTVPLLTKTGLIHFISL